MTPDTEVLIVAARERQTVQGVTLYDRTLIRELATTIASLQKELAEARAERDRAKRRLFPYADATEICGYSTTGIYLIGDRKSIKAVEKAFHYSAQIDEYRTAFDERIKTAEARVTFLSAEVERLRIELGETQLILETQDQRLKQLVDSVKDDASDKK